MNPDPLWTETDAYLEEVVHLDDPVLGAAVRAARSAGLPEIQVSPMQGRALNLLARAIGARRILEVGTLGGYSTIWLARALLPGGQLVSLELEPRHAEVARENLRRAGVADRVEVRVGPALQNLPGCAAESPFDLTFLDADKEHLREYFEWSLRLTRPGGLIIVDNVVRGGEVRPNSGSNEGRVEGTRRFLERLAGSPEVTAAILQTVGRKGHDGWALVLVPERASAEA